MQKFHVKKGDLVVVISGTERGKRGKVLEVVRKDNRILVEGVKMIKKCLKKNTNQNRPQGAIIDREGTVLGIISHSDVARPYPQRPMGIVRELFQAA